MLRVEQTQAQCRVRNLGEALGAHQGRTVEVSAGISSTQTIIVGFQSGLHTLPRVRTNATLNLKLSKRKLA